MIFHQQQQLNIKLETERTAKLLESDEYGINDEIIKNLLKWQSKVLYFVFSNDSLWFTFLNFIFSSCKCFKAAFAAHLYEFYSWLTFTKCTCSVVLTCIYVLLNLIWLCNIVCFNRYFDRFPLFGNLSCPFCLTNDHPWK